MKLLTYIFTFLFFQSCGQKQNTSAQSNSIAKIDTNFLKTIKWDSLNNFVSYYIIKSGTKTIDTNVQFLTKPIATYYYYKQSFEMPSDEKAVICGSDELKSLILSDSFSDQKSIDCLLKINSKIIFRIHPELLQVIFIKPKSLDKRESSLLIKKLKKQYFAQDVNTLISDEKPLNLTDSSQKDNSENTYFQVYLKKDYQNLDKIKEILAQLKRWENINDAFVKDLYSGLNEMELIYRLTTKD